ncbi:hypothetical protein F5X68DRAFT_11698 [Plectosphaerella plurivora]|uniref:Uncharacterized protein n=1 Tax=Plectosphaerella plurivora TaxID=936078 RepID=A0A9P8VB43_9PEZI|nr:hypothetical protein F5X68DRAFT_11698 [Plectosphaerella plurivora]
MHTTGLELRLGCAPGSGPPPSDHRSNEHGYLPSTIPTNTARTIDHHHTSPLDAHLQARPLAEAPRCRRLFGQAWASSPTRTHPIHLISGVLGVCTSMLLRHFPISFNVPIDDRRPSGSEAFVSRFSCLSLFLSHSRSTIVPSDNLDTITHTHLLSFLVCCGQGTDSKTPLRLECRHPARPGFRDSLHPPHLSGARSLACRMTMSTKETSRTPFRPSF